MSSSPTVHLNLYNVFYAMEMASVPEELEFEAVPQEQSVSSSSSSSLLTPMRESIWSKEKG